ncbi:MAG TPA: hypothetical protein VGE50_05525 [Gammaproteobacteria bacterium]
MSRLAFFISLLFSGLTLAAESMVTISAPADGATLDAMTENAITYEVVPGPKGDHSHLYVDGKEDAVLRKLKGSYTLPTLTAGEHNICIKVVNKGHVPIGVEKCVKVMVQ